VLAFRVEPMIDLQCQGTAGEEGGEADNGERIITDAPHLLENLADIISGREALRDGILEKKGDAANFRQEGKHGAADGLERVQA
jgi:hypothetical protein